MMFFPNVQHAYVPHFAGKQLYEVGECETKARKQASSDPKSQ